jgi:nucleoside-diphosphate-sugar epimerase
METVKEIGILGCGWLGKAAAKTLLAKGYKVKGSVTSKRGLSDLQNLGIDPYVVKIEKTETIENLRAFLKNLKVLIISIPPRTKQSEYKLSDTMNIMFDNYDFSTLDKLIYVSSTGVFKDGLEAHYNEDSLPDNNSERGSLLIDLENLVLEQKDFVKPVILRLGGLIKNGGRHPIHFLSGKKNIANPKAPVNLIEQSDAVNLLCSIVETDELPDIYHGVYPFHPSREEYYVKKAKELHLDYPEFDYNEKSLGKIIASAKTQSALDFKYKSRI